MKDLEKFINIFKGLDIAYGVTKKSDEFNEFADFVDGDEDRPRLTKK